MTTVRKGLLLVVACLAVLLLAASVAMAGAPKRVLIVVMDQMHPEYAKQYDMKNVLWLQNHGAWFPNGWVGDMASETVVSHNVMVSGQLPKHMGWSDEAIRDVNNTAGYGAGASVTTGDLGFVDYVNLIAATGGYPKLGDYLRAKFPGTIVANVGQKGYQVESMAASSSDIAVRMGSKKTATNGGDPALIAMVGGPYRKPSGYSVPAYISGDTRFVINSATDYGTKTTAPAWMYPEDGRYTPGFVPGHESGDTWVADAALKIMDHENWSGLWVTFSAIDKIGHMWGGGGVDTVANYGWTPGTSQEQVHLPWIAKHADDQLGRLIDYLKAKGQFNDTLIVVTADHGSTYGENFYGVNEPGGGDVNWYAGTWFPGYGTDVHVPNTSPGSPALKPLLDTGNVAFSYQSTAIETWLIGQSWAEKVAAAKVMRTLPGVIATYIRSDSGDRYVLDTATRTSTKMSFSEWWWWALHGQQLVNTMAWQGSADVVGLLADRTSYGVYGDHGGAQQSVQRIPMIIYSAGMRHSVSGYDMRLADITPTILRALDITPTAPMDGRAVRLPLRGGCD
jgi:hypothetical protein